MSNSSQKLKTSVFSLTKDIKYVYEESEFFLKLKDGRDYNNNQIIGFFKNSLKKIKYN